MSVAGLHEENSAEVVVDSFRDTPDERLKTVLNSLVEHLHAFIKDVEPTHAEWERGVEFLTAVGRMCDETRQEFVLLSDVLGCRCSSTRSTTADPSPPPTPRFSGPSIWSPLRHVISAPTSPSTPWGSRVCSPVRSGRGRSPLAGARVDVWQANGAGFYDVQQPDLQPERNLRGVFVADDEGRFWLRTVVPRYYPIPDDGPVGRLLAATKRHPYRPAHIHVIADADGHAQVTTHVFVEDSPYLDSDTVFGVKQSFIRPVVAVDDPVRAERYRVPNPFRFIEFDVVLDPVTA